MLITDRFRELSKQGKYSELLKLTRQELISSNSLVAKYWELVSMHRLNQIDESLIKAEKYSMDFEKQDVDKTLQARYYNIMGDLYFSKGDLDPCLENYQKGLDIAQKIGEQNEIGLFYSKIALVYMDWGELDRSLEYLEQSLELINEIESPLDFALSLSSSAYIFYVRREFDTAIKNYKKSLNIRKKIGNLSAIATSYLVYIRCLVDKRDRDKAKGLLKEFKTYIDESSDKIVLLKYNFSNALYLKSSTRNRDKVKAEEIFESIVKSVVIDRHITIQSTFHLIELLLAELKLYGEKRVLQEVVELIEKMYLSARMKNMFGVVVRFLILKSKLAIIQGELNQGSLYLDEAIEIAKKRGIKQVVQQAEEEQKRMHDEYEELKKFIDNNQNIGARMARTELMKYVEMAGQISKGEISKQG